MTIEQQRHEAKEPPSSSIVAPVSSPAQTYTGSMGAEVQQARDRAMKIIQQFQSNDPSRADSEIAQKRKASLEQLERRKRIAMVKNLEYLAHAEDERLKSKLQKVHQAQEQQSKMEAYHQQSLHSRLQHLGGASARIQPASAGSMTSNQAGIGTQQRQRAEEKRRKHQSSTGTVAIYVSNLPTDGSGSEELLRELFGGLGYSLRKIHLYVHKETGELKGDALIVYELPSSQERTTLTDTVCSQVRTESVDVWSERLQWADSLSRVVHLF